MVRIACFGVLALLIFSALVTDVVAQEFDEPIHDDPNEPYVFQEDTPDNGDEDVPFNEEPFPESEPYGEEPEPTPTPDPAPTPFDPSGPRNVSIKIIKRDRMDGYCLTFDYISITAGKWLAAPKAKDCIGLEQHTFCPCNFTDTTLFFASSKPNDPHYGVAFDIYMSTGFENRLEITFDFNASPYLEATWSGAHDYEYKLNDRSRGENYAYEMIFTRTPVLMKGDEK